MNPSKRILLQVGPVGIAAETVEDAPLQLGDPAAPVMHRALQDFQAPNDAPAHFQVCVRRARPDPPPTHARPLATHRAGWDIYRIDDGLCALKAIPYGSKNARRVLMWREGQARAELRIAPDDPHAAFPFAYTFSELLTLIAGAARGVALVHGACLELGGEGMLCTGASGCGKSTIAEIWQRSGAGSTAGDESQLVWIDGGRAMVAGTPWPGSSRLWANRVLPLRQVLFLGHGGDNRLDPVDGAEALAALMAQCHLPVWSRAATQAVAATCGRIVESTPAARFAFRPDASAVQCLRRANLPREVAP